MVGLSRLVGVEIKSSREVEGRFYKVNRLYFDEFDKRKSNSMI